LITGWVGIVRLLSQTGLCHFQILTAGPPVCHMEQGTLVRAFCSPVRFDAGVRRRPEGPAMTSSLSSAYKGGSGWKYPPPLSLFLPPHRGEHHHRSSPASHRVTRPFDDSFGEVAPHTNVLLLPQVSQSSGKSFSLHGASRG
jgi:hypothetical protein